ncbi:MAG: tetratricopeptide repeat protein, partial [Myxococcales bacterium]
EVRPSPLPPRPALRPVPAAPAPAPADTAAVLDRARRCADDGRLGEAFRLLEEVLRQTPDAAEAHLLAAMLYATRGEHHEAAAAYRRALFLDERSVAAELGLGECHAILQRPEEARRAFWRALRLLNGRDPGEIVAAIDLPVAAVQRLAQQRLFELEDA